MKKVLIIGSGAREHALAQTFLRSQQVNQVIVAPGNDGMTDAGIQRESILVTDLHALRDFALAQAIDLTFVGNEEPLTLGIVDLFEAAGLTIFGPSKAAAQLEGSKSFTNELLNKYDIPTASSQTVHTLAQAETVVKTFGLPIVFKLDGLALGKGVTIIFDEAQAVTYLTRLYKDSPTAVLVIEEYLEGVEFSVFTLVGSNGVMVHAPLAQDHKRRFDQDKGPNTGGMGAYSPVRWISETTKSQAISELVTPTIMAMQKEGTPFTGVLYTGVMLTKTGPKVIEFNVRFGDPEAQVVLPQYTGDFYALILNLLNGRSTANKWQIDDVYVGVVLVSEGYPESPVRGARVPLPENVTPLTMNYAGVQAGMANGGRVVTVIGHDKTATYAQQKVYNKIDSLDTELRYRHDIAYQAVDSERQTL
ncbi:phosphoribosylamine--glycine ligase [Leuconostoc rapi]|uniref:phosphoribosylamine--glycine ligase n=1 Tax=Leuconostoc rapi TaxID=1406906 RepID=UPI001958307F|nr:phosphoribosylamine--glycine ligase [Leuconostoc rapi]MBM7434903.1 phosphoribosylamine--glycine ligase [Leuconostoc rapi]